MLVENTREETLKAFLNGNKKTMAAVRMGDGSMRFVNLTTLLPADGVYFINVELEPGEDHGEMLLRNHQGGESETVIFPADQALGKDRGTKKEDVGKVKPKKKTAGDIIEPYVRQGLPDSEIAEKTGIKYRTVWAAAKKIRERLEETKGKNADRHLCKTCKYRAEAYYQNGSGIKCEYALKSGTKRTRGCDVEDCDKYEKGAPVRVKDEA